METMEVTGSYVEILSGTLKLTQHQADARKFGLESTSKKGVYKVINRVGFKRGEVFGYEGADLGRGFMLDVNFGRENAAKADSVEEFTETPDPALEVPQTEMTLAELSQKLELTKDETIALLKDYDVKVKKDTDTISPEKVQEVLNDWNVAEDRDDELNPTEIV